MTREEFKELVKNGPVIIDGATGSNLQNAGMPVGVCPEQWILEHPQTMIDLQRAYVEAGTQILLAPTFTANRIKLEEYGLADKLVEMNQQLVAISKEAAGGKALVAGDITMTGQQLYPMGELQFEELVDIYKEQVKVVADAGADLFIIVWNRSGNCGSYAAESGRRCSGNELLHRTRGNVRADSPDRRICLCSCFGKAKCRITGIRGWRDGIQDDTGRICRSWCKINRRRCIHYWWMLWNDPGTYQSTGR